MQQKLLKNFLLQEAGAFRNNIEKKPRKPHPKLKNMCVKYLQIIFALSCNAMQVVIFCKNVLSF